MKYCLILLFLALSLIACGPQNHRENNGIHLKETLISPAEIRALFPGKWVMVTDASYAPFNSAYLGKWHDKFLDTLSHLGLTDRWRPEFDCDSFAALKMGIAQTLYTVHSFHDSGPAQSVAVGEVAYVIEKNSEAHMVNVVIERTEKDKSLRVRFVDIYSGKYLELSEKERGSIFYIRF